MLKDAPQELYDEQITTVVHGFIQAWNKYEATLSRELSHIQERLRGMHPGGECHANANMEIFYRVSSCIQQKESLTMGELSSTLSVPLSSATRIVDWLVEYGYLLRLPDPADRRVVRVALTDIGKELHQTIDRYIGQRVQQILSCLTEEERTILLTLVSKLVDSVKQAAN
jgi:DNA-binding MarR family transcriptional regulator